MNWRRSLSLTLVPLSLGLMTACGHSEEEWQAKLRESQELQNQLNAEKAAHQKAQGELDDAHGQVDKLRDDLKRAGVDLSNLNADLADQKAALEKLKKDKEALEAI